ncbi:glycosyltransferase family 2 protein, partial [Klebsiella oxytoca]
MELVRKDNLPLPIFIRGDDLEYGLRNMKTLILMNGICVWHEPFENKYSSFLAYYVIRNRLIDNAYHFPWWG